MIKKIINLTKNNIKIIFAFIVGIIVSGLTVKAATILYQANQVSFTAEDSNFIANDVNTALNILYNRSKNIDNISSSNGVFGTFIVETDKTYTITLGFKPSKVILMTPTTTDDNNLILVYDSNISESQFILDTHGDTDNKTNFQYANLPSNFGFTITNKGFTYKGHSSELWNGLTYYYAIR